MAVVYSAGSVRDWELFWHARVRRIWPDTHLEPFSPKERGQLRDLIQTCGPENSRRLIRWALPSWSWLRRRLPPGWLGCEPSFEDFYRGRRGIAQLMAEEADGDREYHELVRRRREEDAERERRRQAGDGEAGLEKLREVMRILEEERRARLREAAAFTASRDDSSD